MLFSSSWPGRKIVCLIFWKFELSMNVIYNTDLAQKPAFIRHWGQTAYTCAFLIVLRMNIIMKLYNKELILYDICIGTKARHPLSFCIVLPQPSCNTSILPKKQSRNRSKRIVDDRRA